MITDIIINRFEQGEEIPFDEIRLLLADALQQRAKFVKLRKYICAQFTGLAHRYVTCETSHCEIVNEICYEVKNILKENPE